MTEPTTEARREWDRLIDRFMDFAEYRLPDGETAIRRSMAQTLVAEHRPIIQAAIEAEARASLDVDDCDSILLALGHFPTWFDGTAAKVTALRAILAEPKP